MHVRPQREHLHVLNAAPRMLIVRMDLQIFSMLICSVHGHHSSDHSDEAKCFWPGCGKAIAELRRKDEHILMLTDANAHVHADEGLELTHPRPLCQMVDDLGAVANVFSEPLDTFQCSQGSWVQDDYVVTTPGSRLQQALSRLRS